MAQVTCTRAVTVTFFAGMKENTLQHQDAVYRKESQARVVALCECLEDWIWRFSLLKSVKNHGSSS